MKPREGWGQKLVTKHVPSVCKAGSTIPASITTKKAEEGCGAHKKSIASVTQPWAAEPPGTGPSPPWDLGKFSFSSWGFNQGLVPARESTLPPSYVSSPPSLGDSWRGG